MITSEESLAELGRKTFVGVFSYDAFHDVFMVRSEAVALKALSGLYRPIGSVALGTLFGKRIEIECQWCRGVFGTSAECRNCGASQ